MTIDKSQNKERPNYGVYIPYSFIIFSGLIGGTGLFLIIIGFFFEYIINILLWIIGTLLSIIFLWPSIGLLITNIHTNRQELIRHEFLNGFEAPQILDCGCGTGRHSIQIAKQMPKGSFLTGIDVYDPRVLTGNSLERVQKNAKLEGVAEKTKFLIGSVIDIPFDNELFDIVICMTVLHELRDKKDRKRVFQEIYRVIKPNGIFFMTEINKKASILSSGLTAFAFRTKGYWENQLKINGFKLIKTSNRGKIIEFIAKK